jgi:hypothetical protein
MNRLAKVELELVMHFLDATSLISLARCDRHTLTAALEPFAWKHATMSAMQMDFVSSSSSKLMRHVSLDVS